MPITFTFDVTNDSVNDSNDRNRVVACFKQLGWEHIGGSAWRYPALGSANPSEDWFNHVVPALMYFRSIATHAEWNVTKFTLDAHSEAGFRSEGPIGAAIQSAKDIETYPPSDGTLSEARLRKFIQDAEDSLG
jgi:hypothetical protein